MWLVIDTNQARLIPPALRSGRVTGRATGISLAPSVLAEILLRGPEPRRDMLRKLRQYPVRVGMEDAAALHAIASLNANQIAAFRPFPSAEAVDARRLDFFLHQDDDVLHPLADKWARSVKGIQLGFSQRLTDGVNAHRPRGEKVQDFRAAHAALADGPQSPVGLFITSAIEGRSSTDGGAPWHPRRYRGLWRNAYVRHFVDSWLFYTMCIGRLWCDQRRNRNPVPDRDDWTDLSLSLYVGDGDVIVTNDRAIRECFSVIEPRLKVVTALDL